MKTVAFTPASRAASATACPWLPALAVTTPAARSASESVAMRLAAPRTLKEPVRWRFSALRSTGRPLRRPSVSEEETGVARTSEAIRARAASMSASVGAVRVAIGPHPEYLLHDLTNRGERIELTPLHLAEQPPQLGVLGDGVFEMGLRPRARHGEDLAGEVARPPLGERAALLQMTPMAGDPLPQLVDPFAADGLREDDGRVPVRLRVERKDGAHLAHHCLRGGVGALVDRDHVRDLHDSRLEGLDRVARAGHQDEEDGVGDRHHLHLALPGADGLEEDQILAGGVQEEGCLERRLGKPAEERALREGARRVDGDDPHARLRLAHMADQRADQAGLADAGRTGDADRVRPARLGVKGPDQLVGERIGALDEGDRAGEGAAVAGANALEQGLERPGAGHQSARSSTPYTGSGGAWASAAGRSTSSATPRTRTS